MEELDILDFFVRLFQNTKAKQTMEQVEEDAYDPRATNFALSVCSSAEQKMEPNVVIS